MASNHYTVNKKITINIPVEIEITSISNYFSLSDEEINRRLEDVELYMQQILSDKIRENAVYIDDNELPFDSLMCNIRVNDGQILTHKGNCINHHD